MASVYVLGQKQQVMGFIGVGVQGVEVTDPETALSELKRLTSDPEVALVLVYESLVEAAPEPFEEIREKSAITVLVIPDHLGSHGLMFKLIRESIEKSIGVDLLGKETDSTHK